MTGRCKCIMRYFNTEGVCKPREHYMVRLDGRLEKIKRLYVDRGKYFVINRGRQYGKTTTLRALEEYLKEDYIVVSMDFQGISTVMNIHLQERLRGCLQSLLKDREQWIIIYSINFRKVKNNAGY